MAIFQVIEQIYKLENMSIDDMKNLNKPKQTLSYSYYITSYVQKIF